MPSLFKGLRSRGCFARESLGRALLERVRRCRGGLAARDGAKKFEVTPSGVSGSQGSGVRTSFPARYHSPGGARTAPSRGSVVDLPVGGECAHRASTFARAATGMPNLPGPHRLLHGKRRDVSFAGTDSVPNRETGQRETPNRHRYQGIAPPWQSH